MNNPDSTEKKSSKKWIAILAILSLPLLVGLFYLEEDIMGKLDWSNFKRAEEAKGEKFDLSAFVPPPVPDDQNFAMGPLLRLAFDYVHTTNGLRWRDSNAWQHVMGINLGFSPGSKSPDLGDPEQGTLTDLHAAADFYRKNANSSRFAASQSDGEVVLMALNRFDGDLQELRNSAAARPMSRFPIEYGYQPSTDILLPHLAPVRAIASVCELRAVAELELHHPDNAFEDLQLAFRLSDSIRDEPILIDHLVRIASLESAIQGIREGIARHAWSDSQLLDFEKYLKNLDLLREYQHAMRGERALSINSADYFRRSGFRSLTDIQQENAAAFSWIPSGWLLRNERLIGEMHRDYLLPAVDESNRVVSPGFTGEMEHNLSQLRTGPYNFYAKMAVSALPGSAMRPARAQTWVDEARIACALERYRLEHHTLPDSLETIRPQYIPQLPHDLFDGQLLRYRKNPDGTYILYSVGWDQVDDGGVPGVRTGNTPRSDLTKGDWVWTFPVKKEPISK